MQKLGLLLVGVGLVACGSDDSLSLKASPSSFAADGVTVVTLEARVTFRGDALQDGKRITLTANRPLLFDTREDVAPGEGETEVSVPTRGGVAKAYLLSPNDAADITVSASFTTVNKETLNDSVTVRAIAPPLVSAGRYSSNPAQATVHFAFACSRNIGDIDNIGALVPGRDAIEVPCSVVLKDITGKVLPNVPVQLFAEAGAFVDAPATDEDPRTITYVVSPSPAILPRDVAPTSAESDAGLVDFDAQSRSKNPRDGLVTLLAVVRGHEAFDDANNNGTRDSGEAFLDEGEPFLDVDDDGEYDPDIDGAHCCDWNDNGDVDGPNGSWDSGVLIGRMTHVLWTGPLDMTRSFIAPATLNVGVQQAVEVSLRLVDASFNPIASADDGDEVTLDIAPSSKIQLSPPLGFSADGIPLPNATGMLVRSHPDFLFGYGTSAFADIVLDTTSFFRDWSFTLSDKRAVGSAQCSTAAITLDVTVRATPAPGLSRVTSTLAGAGTLAAKPDPCP